MPITSGTPAPAIARQPASIVYAVHGIFLRSPPISVISLVWQAWITEPEPRNSSDAHTSVPNDPEPAPPIPAPLIPAPLIPAPLIPAPPRPVLPPAAMPVFPEFGVISSLSWSFDLDRLPEEAGAWYLCRATSESTADGYSRQAMDLFDADGRRLLFNDARKFGRIELWPGGSEDEALALSIGLLATRSLGFAEMAPAVVSAQAKLERIMPEALKARVLG